MENKKKGIFKIFLKKTLKRGAIIIGYVIALNVAGQIHSFAADDPIAIVDNLSNFINKSSWNDYIRIWNCSSRYEFKIS